MDERFEKIRVLLSELEFETEAGTAPVGDRDFSALELPLIIQQIVDDLQPLLLPYQAAFYWYLFRHSVATNGTPHLRVGQRCSPGAAIEALAVDAARHGVRRWLLDSSSLDLARMMGWDARRSIESVRAPGHLQGAALLDAVRWNGWSQLCFRSYSSDAAEVAAERIAAMIRSYAEKGIRAACTCSDGNSAAGVHRSLKLCRRPQKAMVCPTALR